MSESPDPIAELERRAQLAFGMYLNADPRNAQENACWKRELESATETLKAARLEASKLKRQ